MSRLQHYVDTSKETHSIALESPQYYQPQHPLFQHAEPTAEEEAARKAKLEARLRKKAAAKEKKKIVDAAVEAVLQQHEAGEANQILKDSPKLFLKKLWLTIQLKTHKTNGGAILAEMLGEDFTKETLATYFNIGFKINGKTQLNPLLPSVEELMRIALEKQGWVAVQTQAQKSEEITAYDAFIAAFMPFIDNDAAANRYTMIKYFLAKTLPDATKQRKKIEDYLRTQGKKG